MTPLRVIAEALGDIERNRTEQNSRLTMDKALQVMRYLDEGGYRVTRKPTTKTTPTTTQENQP